MTCNWFTIGNSKFSRFNPMASKGSISIKLGMVPGHGVIRVWKGLHKLKVGPSRPIELDRTCNLLVGEISLYVYVYYMHAFI